jgi:hypothetical protein
VLGIRLLLAAPMSALAEPPPAIERGHHVAAQERGLGRERLYLELLVGPDAPGLERREPPARERREPALSASVARERLGLEHEALGLVDRVGHRANVPMAPERALDRARGEPPHVGGREADHAEVGGHARERAGPILEDRLERNRGPHLVRGCLGHRTRRMVKRPLIHDRSLPGAIGRTRSR